MPDMDKGPAKIVFAYSAISFVYSMFIEDYAIRQWLKKHMKKSSAPFILSVAACFTSFFSVILEAASIVVDLCDGKEGFYPKAHQKPFHYVFQTVWALLGGFHVFRLVCRTFQFDDKHIVHMIKTIDDNGIDRVISIVQWILLAVKLQWIHLYWVLKLLGFPHNVAEQFDAAVNPTQHETQPDRSGTHLDGQRTQMAGAQDDEIVEDLEEALTELRRQAEARAAPRREGTATQNDEAGDETQPDGNGSQLEGERSRTTGEASRQDDIGEDREEALREIRRQAEARAAQRSEGVVAQTEGEEEASIINLLGLPIETGHKVIVEAMNGVMFTGTLDKCSHGWRLQNVAFNAKVERSSNTSRALTDESSTVTAADEEMEHIAILNADSGLEPHKDHFKYRVRRYADQITLLQKHEGGLEEFAKGYLKFGFNRKEGGIVYREWAPAAQEAQLIGDFNGWDGSFHKMEKNQFGVWSIKIPDSSENPGIPHNSHVKFRFKLDNGIWVDRIPAWIKYTTLDRTRFAAPYNGVYWDPPSSERYHFKHPRPPKPAAPRIYEAHVGMSSSEPRVNSYREFADNVLPRIWANNYNTVQLMAVMEHSYYASFGYHVTNFFAVSSRSGTPEDLKYLIDKAHGLGLQVLMDVVHSHASNNVSDGLNGFDVGQNSQDSYFHTGERGYHKLWISRLFDYANREVLRFLLSNLRWWIDEFKFDGFRFNGVTSMLYHHHGINMAFTGNYNDYFSEATDVDAVVYLMLANSLIHNILPDATVIAEDVSGMPGLGRPVSEGGVGFDYRLTMAIPDKWIDYLKNKIDQEWSMNEISGTLTNRRYSEKCISYAESHDQSIFGDKTIAFLLMDKETYSGMSCLTEASPIVIRGIELHKMIHFITMALGGEGYLNFMGNEFCHPEWIDFPREGNGWSYEKCRRQWDLVDTEHLSYKFMNAFDRAMNLLDENYQFLSSTKQIVSSTNEEDKVIIFERGDLVFAFNFHPENTYNGYEVGCDLPGNYRVALDSDALEFGGHGRVGHDVDHFTSSKGIPSVPETNFNNRPNSFKVLLPSRTCVVYYRVDANKETSAAEVLDEKDESEELT